MRKTSPDLRSLAAVERPIVQGNTPKVETASEEKACARGPPATCGMHASCAVSAGKLILIPWSLPACIRHSIGPLASGLLVEAKRQKEPRLTKRRCGGVRACMLELIKASIHMHASFAADRELESPFPSRERPRGQFSRPHGVARAPQLCRPVFFF